jgi:sulfide:quinone oxidoreductase
LDPDSLLTDRRTEGPRPGRPLEVVIAGAGVAGLEGLLALHHLAGRRVSVELLAPEREFVYRPLSVAEPFGHGRPQPLDIAELAARHGARHRRDTLAGIDPERRRLHTGSGRTLRWDALLLAMGARPVESVHGALTFRGPADVEAFGRLLRELRSRRVRSVAFAVHERVGWPLPLYELALMTATHLDSRGVRDVEITVVTHEDSPLGLLGESASAAVRALLEDAGVRIATRRVAHLARNGRLLLDDDEALSVERVVALPELRVPLLTGIPRGAGGYIPTDRLGRVRGLERVFAAGDSTTFPIKQGGLAAQQADVAAAGIARLAGAPVNPQPADLMLHAALLTGSTPRFLSTAVSGRNATADVGRSVLWAPPGKLAARYLAPHLSGGSDDEGASNRLRVALEASAAVADRAPARLR